MSVSSKFHLITVFISLCVVFFSINIIATEIFLEDGQVYSNVNDLFEVNSFYTFKRNGKSYSINKNRIKKIISDKGETIYEKSLLIVEVVKNVEGADKFIFYKNKKKLGEAVWDSYGEFDILSGDIPDGVYKQYYDAGKLRRTFTFKDGELNGWSKEYYISGKIEREGYFKNNKEVGISKIYYDTGVLKGESTYVDGVKDGETKLFYKTGNIKAKMNFKDNQPEGLQVMYYQSGNIETKVYFEGGVKNGPIKQYYESGKIKMTGTLDDGKLNGTVITYYESGRIKKKVTFIDGRILKDK